MTDGNGADQSLIAAARRDDGASFDALVRKHTRRMYGVALRILGDPVEAEDAVQDAWVSAWRSLDTFRNESAVSTWLYRIVTNAALGQIRRRKPTVSLDAADDAIAPQLEDRRGDTPETRAVRSEQVRQVHRAIAALEPSQRVPLVLRELEGLSYEEVAAVLDVNVSALRSRLHRARMALLAKLEEGR